VIGEILIAAMREARGRRLGWGSLTSAQTVALRRALDAVGAWA